MSNEVYVFTWVPPGGFGEAAPRKVIRTPIPRIEASDRLRGIVEDMLSIDLSMSDPLAAAKYLQHKARDLAALASDSKEGR